MITLIRTEWLKLRTIRLPWGLLGAAAGLTALMTILMAARAGGGGGDREIGPLFTRPGLTEVISITGFGTLMAMVFGATVAAGEFRHGTATSTYLATPDRNRVLIAKAAVAAGVGLLFGLVATALTTGISLAFVAAKGYHLALPGITIARFSLGAVLGGGLFAAVGVGLGSLLRSQLASTITVFAWFVVEQIIGGLYHSIQPYLPFTAATNMGGSPLEGGTSPLPFAAGAALVVAVAIAISAVAAGTTVQRDIS